MTQTEVINACLRKNMNVKTIAAQLMKNNMFDNEKAAITRVQRHIRTTCELKNNKSTSLFTDAQHDKYSKKRKAILRKRTQEETVTTQDQT